MKYFILFCAALLTYMGTEAQIYNTGVLYVGSGNILSDRKAVSLRVKGSRY